MAAQEQASATTGVIEVEVAPVVLSIHDQRFWDQDLEGLQAQFEPYRDVRLDEMSTADVAQFAAYVWKVVLHDRDILQALALETKLKPAPKPRAPRKKATLATVVDGSEEI